MTQDTTSVPALRAERLGKRYGRAWGLRDCTFAVPARSVVGLAGPNGAGKTTLLALTVGLLAPTEGHVAVFGEQSRAQEPDTLARVSYLAQDHPLYRGFTVADMFRFGRSLNPSWDQALAEARMATLGIPLRRKVKALSGGQQAQVALTMALAKRAPVLALDEPVASLDPIARLDFMRDVLAASAETGLTVIIASHVIAELERLCDWLLVLNGGRLQLAGAVDDLLAGHAVLTVPRPAVDGDLPGRVIERTDSDRHSTVLVAAAPDLVSAAAGRVQLPCELLCGFSLALLAGLLLRNTIGAMVAAYFAWEAPFVAGTLMTGPIHIVTTTTIIPCAGSACTTGSTNSSPPVTGNLGDLVLGVTHGGGHLIVNYLPASEFWPLQFIIGGMYLAIAAAAVGATVWLLHRRTT
jgi:ABC-2 type transport system ATP-binding protein